MTALVVLVISASIAAAQSADHLRRLPLEGASNLRDLGGYATADGRHVRWGLVYRSDQLARLTDNDYEYLARLGIATVCDFRRDDERQRAVTRWRGSNPPQTLLRLPAARAATARPDPAAALSAGGTADEDRKSTRLNSSHIQKSRMPSSA